MTDTGLFSFALNIPFIHFPAFFSLPVRVETPTTLPELFAAHGLTVEQAARGIDVEVELLDRVIAGRQPLAMDLVQQLAVLLGVGQGDVAGCAGNVTSMTGPRAHVALPPEVVFGEAFPTFPLAETAAPPLAASAPPSLVIWVCGADLGTIATEAGQLSGVVRIERNSGLLVGRTNLLTTNTPVELATDGQTVFTAGAVDIGAGWGLARLLPSTGALLGEVAQADVREAFGVIYEPLSETLWVCDQGLPRIVEIDRNTGLVIAVVQLVSGALGYGARDVVAVGGLLYVTGTRAGPPNVGLVFEVDPVAKTLLRTSVGLNLEDAWGIVYDPTTAKLWVTSAGSSGNTPMLASMTVSTLVPSTVTLSSDPLVLTDPSWIEYLFGTFWITDVTVAGSRLMQVDGSGTVLQSRTFGGDGGGHCVTDGWFLWYADKAAGVVHLLNPGNITTSLTTSTVGGRPDGMLIL